MVDKWIGKIAVVTGASAGIGAAIFKDLAKAGITVIGLARRSEKVEALIKELGATKGKAFAYKCDVSDPKSVKETFKWIESKFGTVNILVNNAGVGRAVNILDDNEEAFTKLNEIIDTNIRGLVQCSREAYRLMKKSDEYGYIINVNSIVGHRIPFMPFPMSAYPGSKYAVTAITETLRQELVAADNKKVRVTSLSPGGVATEFGDAAGFEISEELMKLMATAPMLKSEDVSHSVMFLLTTPYTVNVTELTIQPTGERF